MKTIIVCNQKGGVGKSFLADELCYMCERSNIPYTLLDYDQQGSLSHEPIVEDENTEIRVIDTPGALNEDLLVWIDNADLVIIPTTMGLKSDKTALNTMMKAVKRKIDSGGKVLVVLNCWDRYKAAADFEQWFFEKYPTQPAFIIPRSVLYVQAGNEHKSILDYRPVSKPADEMMKFFKVVMHYLYD